MFFCDSKFSAYPNECVNILVVKPIANFYLVFHFILSISELFHYWISCIEKVFRSPLHLTKPASRKIQVWNKKSQFQNFFFRYVILISGLGIGASNHNQLALQLFIDLITGHLGSEQVIIFIKLIFVTLWPGLNIHLNTGGLGTVWIAGGLAYLVPR